MEKTIYFAYGSNMNLDQMEYRCPAARVLETVRLEGYRLGFYGRSPGCGVATILPEQGSCVEGVLWEITAECEQSLNRYEGYPYLYGKQQIQVGNQDGTQREAMVYVMDISRELFPSRPSGIYLNGILEGCRQNGIPETSVLEAVSRTRREIREQKKQKQPKFPTR